MTKDERFILTADAGNNSLLIVWDTQAEDTHVVPVKMISEAHKDAGIIAAVFSASGKYIYTLGNGLFLLTLKKTHDQIHLKQFASGTGRRTTTAQSSTLRSIRSRSRWVTKYSIFALTVQIGLKLRPEVDTEFMTFGSNSTFFYTWGSNEGIQMQTPIHNEK